MAYAQVRFALSAALAAALVITGPVMAARAGANGDTAESGIGSADCVQTTSGAAFAPGMPLMPCSDEAGNENGDETGGGDKTATPTDAGAGTTAPPNGVPGEGSYDDTSSSIRYTGAWRTLSSRSDSGGSSAYLNSTGSASLTFRGTSISWVSRTTAASGIADVRLDGQLVATVDRYSEIEAYQRDVFTRNGLPLGQHTITVTWSGRANPASSGRNLLVDRFVVHDVDAPSVPQAAAGAVSADGTVSVTWAPVSASDLFAYRLYRVAPTGTVLIGVPARSAAAFDVVGEPANTTLRYAVSAVDAAGNESALSSEVSVTTGATPVGSNRYLNCPSASVTVSTVAQLKSAIAGAKPGTSIRLAPGTYPGQQISITARGTAAKPVWICGPRTAVIDGGSVSTAHGILVASSSYVVVSGMTVRNFLKGVTVRTSDHVTISDIAIDTVGYEGVHLRENTTDSTVVGNTITRTGRLDPFYGEGVYIGSSSANWCALTACQPDRSDRNTVAQNSISATGSDLVEAKEGTTGGVIAGNILDGTDAMTRAEAWVKIGGNNWNITSNRGTNSTLNGFRLQGRESEWGLRNVFSGNTAAVNATGYGFELYEPAGPGTTGTVVSCNNTVTGAGKGHDNIRCTPVTTSR